MAQQIINYDEEMVGANHPTKSDTLNRGFLVSHAENGGVRSGDAFPGSGLEDRMMFYRTDLDRLYVYDLTNTLWRPAGATMSWLASTVAVVSSGTATTWTSVDCSAVVPAGAKAVILELEWVLGAAENRNVIVYLRPDSSSAEIRFLQVDSVAANQETYGQAILPLDADRTLDYKIVHTYSTQGAISLNIAGYM